MERREGGMNKQAEIKQSKTKQNTNSIPYSHCKRKQTIEQTNIFLDNKQIILSSHC